MNKRLAVTAISILLLVGALSGCSVEQLKAWYDLRGIDHSQFTEQQLNDGAAIATAYWEAVRNAPPPVVEPPPAPQRPYLGPFLECVRWRESRGDYTAHNYSSGASGAFQFLQSTWDNTARHAGWYFLVGIQPRWVEPYWQDMMALHLLGWYGTSPWAASAPHNC